MSPRPTRSGFVALAGRPNVGKSTLANAVVGAKVAIVSDKPQTTRRAIRGVANGPDWQLVLVDLPGVQRPRDALTERMQRRVEHELDDADGCLFVVNAEEVFPVSAATGSGVTPLVDSLVSLLPEGPFYFEPEQRSDQTESVLLAELVREQVLARTREEVPHSVEVVIEGLEQTETPRGELIRIDAVILAETESQKRILIGAGGQMVKSIGIASRRAIERELGSRVHLDLKVRVRRHWRADERMLDRLGIE